jgi:predicted ATP-dependent serine protease
MNLSRLPCITCATDTVHRSGACIHCDTHHQSVCEKVSEKWMANFVERANRAKVNRAAAIARIRNERRRASRAAAGAVS